MDENNKEIAKRLELYSKIFETRAEEARQNWTVHDDDKTTDNAVWYDQLLRQSSAEGPPDDQLADAGSQKKEFVDDNDDDETDTSRSALKVSALIFKGMEFHEVTRAFCKFLIGRPDLKKPEYLVQLGMFEDGETYEKKRNEWYTKHQIKK